MINIHELRIGNWVQYDDGPTPTKVHNIDFYRENVGVDRFPQPLSPSVLLPIELTPELLEACGFENTHPESWHLSWESYELQYSTDDKELGILSPHGCTSGHTVYFPCGQLHLLQNIYFFFTGSELSIYLEKVKA